MRAAIFNDFLDDMGLLVDLDGEDPAIVVVVIKILDGVLEIVIDLVDLAFERVGNTQQDG